MKYIEPNTLIRLSPKQRSENWIKFKHLNPIDKPCIFLWVQEVDDRYNAPTDKLNTCSL